MEIQTIQPEQAPSANGKIESLVKMLAEDILPALAVYYPKTQFAWRGYVQNYAREYGQQLFGSGVSKVHIMQALDAAKSRSTQEQYAPTPIEFRHMCLQAAGMPTLEACIEEIESLRVSEFGPKKRGNKPWSCPFVYWLSARTSGSRAHMSDPQWRKMVKLSYSKLADKFAAGEIQPIPRLLENNQEPAYMKYMGKGAA
ncbi:replication protein P [Pseudoalteromonas sp. R3]|uniref:replication protein P n=1 Tax=Pseudoalteromonas sp. R3 TaxID=1709477 RepID=UPI0006B4C472|nr:replication protein P [Pseudoalteromonas sp. R3]AZZ98775.1 hypothetical protein ELR70_17715 [Pseudoalteromonas sp. R3]